MSKKNFEKNIATLFNMQDQGLGDVTEDDGWYGLIFFQSVGGEGCREVILYASNTRGYGESYSVALYIQTPKVSQIGDAYAGRDFEQATAIYKKLVALFTLTGKELQDAAYWIEGKNLSIVKLPE